MILPHPLCYTLYTLIVYPIANSFSEIVAGHPADDTAENTANDCADGGERLRDARCSLVIVHQNSFLSAWFS